MKNLKKIWADPVWSKLISTGIVTLLGLIASSLWDWFNKVHFVTAWKIFWNLEIKLWCVTVAMILVLLSKCIKFLLHKTSFHYDDETIQLDRSIFNKIRNDLLPQTGTIDFLRRNNFAGFSFDNNNLDNLDYFEDKCRKSDFEFSHPVLEKIRTKLFVLIDNFTTQIARYTFPHNNGRQTVPPEWEDEQPERFWEVLGDLHNTKFEIYKKYDDLIKLEEESLKYKTN